MREKNKRATKQTQPTEKNLKHIANGKASIYDDIHANIFEDNTNKKDKTIASSTNVNRNWNFVFNINIFFFNLMYL